MKKDIRIHYILQGRPVLSEAKDGRGQSPKYFGGFTKALALSKGYIKGRMALLWQGCIIFISDLGYSDLRRSGHCHSEFQSALQSPCACTMNSIYCQYRFVVLSVFLEYAS